MAAIVPSSPHITSHKISVKHWLDRLFSILIGCVITILSITAVQATAMQLEINDDAILYVNHAAVGANDGSSWEGAFTALQPALDAATEGDEIWVAQGTYLPTVPVKIEDPASATFWIKTRVGLYGGFGGGETSREQADWQAHPTLLSGDLGQDDVDIDHDGLLESNETVGVNARHVLYATYIPDPIEIEGFTICSGYDAAGAGAGIYIDSSMLVMRDATVEFNHAVNGGGIAAIYSSLTLERVTFLGNSARLGDTGGGGGVYIFGATGNGQYLNEVTFDSNQAGYAGGGGLRVEQSWTVLTNGTFIHNVANSNFYILDPVGGGGMYVVDGGLSLARTLFQDNHATGALVVGGQDIPERFIGHGGGLYVRLSSYEIVGVTFQDNSAALGGGFYNYVAGEGQVRDVNFINNHAYYLGGGAYGGYISPHYQKAIFFNNRAPYCGGLCGWVSIKDSVFAYNHAYDPIPTDENYHGVGGAINGHVNDIFNSSFYANTADYSGPDFAAWYSGKLINVTMSSGIDCPNGSNLTIVNSIIHQMGGNCDVTFMNSLYGEVNVTSITDGGGNLPDVDPLFIDQEGGNVRLQTGSPAIDSGDTAQAIYTTDNPILVDLDGNQRVKGSAVDMGAYEYGAVLLDVSLDGQGWVSSNPTWIGCEPDCQQAFDYVYPMSYPVTLTATPAPGWTFAGWDFAFWDDQADTTDNPLALTIENDTTLTATFTQDEYTLEVSVVGSGTVTPEPNQSTYHYDDVVTLTATPEPGWFFTGWSGDVVSNQNPLSVEVMGNTQVTATFINRIHLPLMVKSSLPARSLSTSTSGEADAQAWVDSLSGLWKEEIMVWQ